MVVTQVLVYHNELKSPDTPDRVFKSANLSVCLLNLNVCLIVKSQFYKQPPFMSLCQHRRVC